MADKEPLINKARRLVHENVVITDAEEKPVALESLAVVWWSKTLQNWKALVTVTPPNGQYFEITYDGDRDCAYIDSYIKEHNFMVEV